jgi:HAD superfamily hydrolase (TIGR01509 family)
MVHAVLFDLDGTLVDSERQYGEAMARALRDGPGLEISQADRDYVIGHSWIAIHAHLVERYGLTWPRDELIAATAAASKALFALEGARELPGARAAITRFADRHRALVTGSSRAEAGHMLELLGVADAFAFRLCAEDVPRSKPAPDGYMMACERLGIEPRHAVVVEDSAAGVAAGRAAGCIVIAVRAGNFANHDQSAAHRVIDTLEQLTTELVGEVAALASSGYGAQVQR